MFRLEIAIANRVLMALLDSMRHFGHKPDAFAQFVAQDRLGFLQASPSRVFMLKNGSRLHPGRLHRWEEYSDDRDWPPLQLHA